MKLSNFTYELPDKLLAEYPSDQRDESRLMVLHRDSNKIEHKLFKDVIDYFEDGDSFILNDTKVFPARLMGNKEKTGAKIEVFLLRELSTDQRLWDVLVDPARKIRIGNKLYFGLWRSQNLISPSLTFFMNLFFVQPAVAGHKSNFMKAFPVVSCGK